jgi:N-acetyl-alpha-D-glucosaminyl L-malate synthase BshA
MNGPLRIGLICHRGVGGSTRVAVRLATELARRDHEVHVFTRSAPLGMTALPGGTSLHTISGGSPPVTTSLDDAWCDDDLERLTGRVVEVVEESALDVLHFHYAVPFVRVLAEVRRRLRDRCPVLVGTLHGTDVSAPRGFAPGGGALAGALAALDAITTVSRSHAALAVRTLRLPHRPEVIPNFVDTARFHPGNGHARNGDAARLVHVSNFRPVKDPRGVARVFIEIRRRMRATLWLVGDGEELGPVETMLDGAGVMEDVRRFGLRLDVESILPAADALLLTSRTESFSLAALEAAACGVPVVAPRVGGLPEVVAHGRTGHLYDPSDEAAAVRALTHLLEAPEVRKRMGRAAVEQARRFAPASVVPRYEMLYRRILRRKLGSGQLNERAV